MLPLQLFTNAKAVQFFQLARQGTSILIAILLAKSTLSTAQIGAYELLFYLGFITSFFWTSGLMQGMLSMYPRESEANRRRFVFNSFFSFCLVSVTLALFMWGGRSWLLPALTGQGSLDYYALFLWFSLFNLPATLQENFYLLHNQPRQLYVWAVFSFSLQLAAVLIPVFWGSGLAASFFWLVVLAVAKWSWLTVYVVRHGSWVLDRALLGRWWALSTPLMLYALISGINQSFDSWLVGYSYPGDEAAFAVFRYGAREFPLVLAMANAFSTAMLPEIAKNLESGLEAVKSKSISLLHALFPASIALMLGSKWLFPIVFSAAFEDSVLIFNIFLLITISRLVFSRTVLVGLQDNRLILLISLVEFGVHIVAGFILVHYWGLAGVACGALIAYTLEKVLICFYLYSKHGIGVGRYTPMRWYLFYSAALLASFAISLLL